jgi:transposase
MTISIVNFNIYYKGHIIYLFSDTVSGAKASANLYSLIETAKANGLEPYAYLKHVFTELPKATCVEEIEALLPFKTADELEQAA